MRKVLATVAVVCGVGLIAAPFALSLFDRAPAGERVMDRFRATMSVQGLHSLAANFGTMGALLRQFTTQTTPALASELHMSGPQYAAYVRRQFPAVAAGINGLPPIVAFVSPVAAQLETLHPQFANVDTLPFLGLPLTSAPWILIAAGLAMAALGAATLLARGRGPLVCAAVLGAGVIVVPLALDYPGKTSDANRLATVGKAALSRQAASGAQTANRLIDGLVTQVESRMIPAVARRLHTSSGALSASIAARYPAVARGLAAWPGIKPGAFRLASLQAASVGDAATLNGLDFTVLLWCILGPGIALLICAAGALARASRPTRGWDAGPMFGSSRARA